MSWINGRRRAGSAASVWRPVSSSTGVRDTLTSRGADEAILLGRCTRGENDAQDWRTAGHQFTTEVVTSPREDFPDLCEAEHS